MVFDISNIRHGWTNSKYKASKIFVKTLFANLGGTKEIDCEKNLLARVCPQGCSYLQGCT